MARSKDWEAGVLDEEYRDTLLASVHVRTGSPGPVLVWSGDWAATWVDAAVRRCRDEAAVTPGIDAWQWSWIGIFEDIEAVGGYRVAMIGGRYPSGREEWALTEHRAFFQQAARVIGEGSGSPTIDVLLEVGPDGLTITAPVRVDADLARIVLAGVHAAVAEILDEEVVDVYDVPLRIARLSLQYQLEPGSSPVERWREYSWRTLSGSEEFRVEPRAFARLAEDALG